MVDSKMYTTAVLNGNNQICCNCDNHIDGGKAYCQSCYESKKRKYYFPFGSDKPTLIEYENCNPVFYCSVNIDQVPEDAVGKEWEFSNDGKNWEKYNLLFIEKNSVKPFKIKEYWEEHAIFMRPIQLKPVKRMDVKEALKYLAKNNGFSYSISNDWFVSDFNPAYYKTRQQLESFLSKRLNCEVVIDV
jgi:hypothetical protein